MAATTPASPTLPSAPSGDRWLYGPATDLLLGAGVGYAISIPLLALFSASSGSRAWPTAVAALFALGISGPHYGATILRVYEHREDRRKYAFFAVWATAGLATLFVGGLHSTVLASLLITVYATWSPWHFSGQNYGIALMFLRRRGIPVETNVKRLLYASFVLSFLCWIFVMHGEGGIVGVAGTVHMPGTGYEFLSLGIPASGVAVLLPLTGIAYAITIAAAIGLLLREARLADLAPTLCLVVLQALWYAVPALLRVAGWPLGGLAFAVIWISAAHAAQYLWITSWYAKREDAQYRLGSYLLRALLAGSAVTILPGLLFAPQLLGTVPWDLGLAILLISVVNLHHFVLDGAIWKLRDGRVARLLIRNEGTDPTEAAHRAAGFRPAIAVAGLLALGIAGTDLWQREFVVNRSRDLSELEGASRWLAWIGRDSPQLHAYLGRSLATRDPDAAVAAYRRSLDLHPTPAAWTGLGQIEARRESWSEASRAFDAALAGDPDHVPALIGSARVWLAQGQREKARAALETARALAPRNPEIREMLRRADAR